MAGVYFSVKFGKLVTNFMREKGRQNRTRLIKESMLNYMWINGYKDEVEEYKKNNAD
jgi:hypothetical protein